MGNNIYETDGMFDTANSATYRLFVEVGANHHSYAVLDENHNLKAISFKGTSILSNIDDSNLTQPYSSTKISLNTSNFTFIPTSLYNSADEANYAQFLNGKESPDLHTHQFLDAEITSLNTFDETELQEIKNLFPLAEIYPQYIPFIEGSKILLKEVLGKQLIINLKANNLEILILEDSKLQFYNFFQCLNDEEILYYLLATCQQNKIDPQEISLNIAGDLTQYSNAYSLLQKAFNNTNLTFIHPIRGLGGQVELHQFFSLLSLNQCG